MGKIDTSEWKEFSVCELFGKSKLGKYHSPESLVESETGYPYICASNQNNGVNQKMSLVSGDDVRPTPQNIISWGKQCPYFTFHEEPCVTGQGMYYIVVPKYIPRRAIRYVITVLQSAVEGKFGYSDCFIGSSMDDLSIKLPTTPDGDPDWAYMESYMANLETKVAESLTLLQAAKDAEKKKVDTREWGEFHLYDIFSISMGNKFDRSKMCEVDEGINFVGRSALTNGVACAVTSVEDKKGNTVQPYPAGDITIALGGSIGAAFVQDKEFYTSQNVCVLHTDDHSITERAKWFVAASITASCGNYEAFTDELNKHIRTDFIIRLPMDKTGQPDWAYMEEYMRKVERKTKTALNTFCVIRNIKFDC